MTYVHAASTPTAADPSILAAIIISVVVTVILLGAVILAWFVVRGARSDVEI